MARINMEDVVDELDEKFATVLAAVFADLAPDAAFDRRQIMRQFRTRLERGFSRWERVADRCVETD